MRAREREDIERISSSGEKSVLSQKILTKKENEIFCVLRMKFFACVGVCERVRKKWGNKKNAMMISFTM